MSNKTSNPNRLTIVDENNQKIILLGLLNDYVIGVDKLIRGKLDKSNEFDYVEVMLQSFLWNVNKVGLTNSLSQTYTVHKTCINGCFTHYGTSTLKFHLMVKLSDPNYNNYPLTGVLEINTNLELSSELYRLQSKIIKLESKMVPRS